RYVNKLGKRKDKYFKTVQEARNWLYDAKYEDKYNTFTPSDMTVNDRYVHVSDESLFNAVEQFEMNANTRVG
ncbi:MAG: hypothetical protein IJN62_02095, partial [Clostridia bacterium]|nr:hypothetical protein [Clostridia bacterium]